jgi:hypothetical protein
MPGDATEQGVPQVIAHATILRSESYNSVAARRE